MRLSNEQVIKLAEEHGLVLNKSSLERNESGLDFLIVMSTDMNGEKWVLRIPRRKDVIDTSAKEKKNLDFVGCTLPIQIPKWEIYTDELIAYKLLNGVPAGTIDPEDNEYMWEINDQNVPDAFHTTLGEAMVALHRLSPIEAKQAGIAFFHPEDLKNSMKTRMDKVKIEFAVNEDLWNRWQSWLENDQLWPQETAFIHGDLHPGHILIDETAHVTGFIDWTEARFDDPAHDFVAHLAAFGEDALKELIVSYKKAGGYVWPLMFEHIHELAAAYPVAIAEYAIKSGSEEFEAMAKYMLGAAE